MVGSNTINPAQVSSMSAFPNDNPAFDPSQADGNASGNFNIDNFDFDGLDGLGFTGDFPMDFEDGSGYDESLLGQADDPAPALNKGPAPTSHFFPQAPQEMVPMQPAIDPSPTSLIPNQVLPTPPPGLAYHPAVGWYYPASAPVAGSSSGALTPQYAVPGPAAMNAPFATAPVPTNVPNIAPPVPPFQQATQFDEPTLDNKRKGNRTSPRNKRKYGPSAYLAEQIRRRAEGDDNGPRPVSRGSVNFYYDNRRRSTRQSPRLASKQAPPKPTNTPDHGEFGGNAPAQMKDLKAAIVQKCRCASAQQVAAAHIPRPRNGFIIFRSDFSARWKGSKGQKRGLQNTQISSEAGKAWRALGEKGQEPWMARANQEKEALKAANPDYAYTPSKQIQARFGNPSCTCGAYALNMAELKRRRSSSSSHKSNLPDVAAQIEHEDREIARPRTRSQSRAQIFQAPTAPMTAGPFDVGVPDFGFTLDNHNFAANAEWETLMTFTSGQDDELAADQPPLKRRSPRSSAKTIHYGETADEDEFEFEFEEAESSKSGRKNRPGPISTSRKPSSHASEIKSADFSLFLNEEETDGPASRTRSKSIAEATEAQLTGGSNGSNMGSLFGEDEEVGENIVIASPKTRAQTQKTVLALPGQGVQTRGTKRSRS